MCYICFKNMSSERNVNVRDSNEKKEGRIVLPTVAKSFTNDEIMSSEYRSRSFGESSRNKSSTLPFSNQICDNVGSVDHFQAIRSNLDICRSSKILDSCVISNDSQPLEKSREIKVFPGSSSELNKLTSSATITDNVAEKNKKSSADQKRFYQRKFSGLSGIKLPVGRFFKFLRPPLQRRNSCPVLSISELKSDVKANGTTEVKPEDLPNAKVIPDRDINSQHNLSCRLTKWTSHSELLQPEVNIPHKECVIKNKNRISLRNRNINTALNSELTSVESSLEGKANSFSESQTNSCITNFGTNASRISKIESVKPFVVEKTVIIVSENSPAFACDSDSKCSEKGLNSSYISNIDTSIPYISNALIYLDSEKKSSSNGIDNSIKGINETFTNQVKVINSLSNNPEVDHLSCHHSSTNLFQVHQKGFEEKYIDRTYQQTQQQLYYSNSNSLEKSREDLTTNSTNDNLCRLNISEGNSHSYSTRPAQNSSTDINITASEQPTKLHFASDGINDSEYQIASNSLDSLQCKQNIITANNNELHTSYEPLYAVVKKFSSSKTHVLNNWGNDQYHNTNVDSSYEAQTYKISENGMNRTLAYFGCRKTVKTTANKQNELKINPALYICEVDNSFLVQNNQQNQVESGYFDNVFEQNTSSSYPSSEVPKTSNDKTANEIQNSQSLQPQQIHIVYNQVRNKQLSEKPFDTAKCPILNVNCTENSSCISSDVLDFGENSSHASTTDLQNEHITECYNVKLDAPEEVIVAGFHDFCHTMLSLEDGTEIPDTGTVKRRPGYKKDKTELSANKPSTNMDNHLDNITKIEKNNIQSLELSKRDTMSSVLTTQEPACNRTSDVSEESISFSSDKLLEEIQNSKSLDKMSIKDPDVIDAMTVLDNSLLEISESAMDPVIGNLPRTHSEGRKSREETHEKPDTKCPVKISKEDKIQCDNLIEELTFEGISKRVSNIFNSSDSASVQGESIAVTISSMKTQQTFSNLKDTQNLGVDLEQEQSPEGSNGWLNTRSPNSLKVTSISSDIKSCYEDISSDFYDPENEMKKVNHLTDFPTSMVPGSPNAVYPLQVSIDHNSCALLQNCAAANRTSPCSVDSGTSSHNQGFFVVVAIDFGTTYSGYAFSFTRDPDNIHMMKKWDGGDPGVFNQKTPTTLLLSPEGTFHSFGYSARDYYHDLDEEEAKKWLYFEKFKMTLHHNEHLSLETEIAAANGKHMPAVTVFAHALRYFKDHALQELSDQSATKILNEDVRWVVTVPAIWKQPAKQFMRVAAYKAGIASPDYPEQLLIALEPEAASIYCRKMRLHQLVPDETHFHRSSFQWKTGKEAEPKTGLTIRDKDFSSSNLSQLGNDNSFTSGTRYMVVDCGGGTVDITVHELLDKQGTLKELQKASGGPYGAIGVDMEFEKLLCDIFGEDFIQQFKFKRPTGYVDLMIAFEARKRNANPYKTNPLNISLPYSFIEFYEKCTGSSVESAIKKSSHKNVKWSSQGMLRLEPPAMEDLFRRTIEKIIQHIESIINQKDIGIDDIFLVGGFAESLILQKEIKDAFSSRLKVIIPQGVSLAILKGAVLFGLDPTTINIRRLRMTYGVGVLNRFIHGVHPREKLVIKDGIQWCADVFDKFVVNEQSVDIGDVVVRCYTPAKDGQSCSVIHIYCSEKDNVYFITDPGVKRCATLILDLSDSRFIQGREIQTQMMFGDTEIKVSALDVTTGKCVKAEIDFLNQ
ncbi:uncharacterized protein LOC129959051 isoform X1 [Argiope bruennichi]|nr:uncharacterized protein LOC129959051 isoform X1 [Argiope bruennichi]